ncbi:MAG: C1 family peptidase [Prolixibacteraceae bacterium]|jgi:bleomycin hydrolase|nr:C1 family peptidase [Prolixibacteraceae bacterium]
MGKLRYALLGAGFIIVSLSAEAKKEGEAEKGYQFTTIHEIPTTSVKDQYHSGTCWSFSGIGMLEAEMLRLGKPELDLSEMYVVWHTYSEKAIKHVRLHGNLNFSAGGAFHDVINMIRKYGIVPESVYDGLNYGEDKHVHGEMDRVLSEQVNAVIENKNKKLSTAWHDALKSTLSSYLGKLPESFTYEGKQYSPLSFAKDYVGLNMDDYVEISSYTHHPFYSKFILEVPDNWSWDEVYNVPIEELEQIIDNSLENGYTVAWAADISEKGFSTSKKGVAVVPEINLTDMDGAEISKWEKLTDKEKEEKIFELNEPGPEKIITQEMRQIDFDDYQTTDDHGMLIVGTAKDQHGSVYYKIKNSWGKYNDYDGYFFASRPYVRYKTMCIMVNKEAIPKNIRKKLNL